MRAQGHDGGRIPTLDGWRGIAILMVLISHFQLGLFHGQMYHHWAWLEVGGHGVEIFFVLSGYLITSKLFDDRNLKHFYIRRFFRLMPAAWIYLASVAILGLVSRREIWASLLLYRNFVFQTGPEGGFTGHFWTLSVEEQFYLIWPALLVLGGRRAAPVALAGAGLFALFPTAWAYSALFVGCSLAFGCQREDFRNLIARHGRWLLPMALIGMAWHVATFLGPKPISEPIVIALALACTSINPPRVLEWRPLARLGACSYSVYVWQQVCLLPNSHGLLIAFLPLAAIGSYKLVEEPGIRLGKLTAGRRDTNRSRASTTRAIPA